MTGLTSNIIDPATLWLALLLLVSIIIIAFCVRCILRLRDEIKVNQFELRGFHVKAGNIAEQLAPLTTVFPWDPRDFKFLGKPVDGIQFEKDRIVLVEFKTGKSKLTKDQRVIKKLVENHEVYFEEIRIG